VHALGTRPGAAEAAAELDHLFRTVVPEFVAHPTEAPHGL